MLAFQNREELNLNEVLNICFGVTRYNPILHDAKLANLLSRANRVFSPFVKFIKRHAMIHANIDREHIVFARAAEHTLLLNEFPEAHERILSRIAIEKTDNQYISPKIAHESQKKTQLIPYTWLSRRELEDAIGCSRSTALRRINSWISEALITKRGIGKASRYQITQELHRQIIQQRGVEI